MTAEEAIQLPSTGVHADLVEKAVTALLKHHEQEVQKSSEERGMLPLLGTDRPLQVQIGLERAPSANAHKPTRILIPHPLYKVASENEATEINPNDSVGVQEPSVCIIVKEESKPWVKEMVTRFQKYMGCVKKVLGLESLRKKHARYEQRRELLHKYDVFLADDRILPMIGKALGRDFYKFKKLPIPLKLTRKEALPLAVRNALAATFVTLSQGTCVMIRAGNTGMPVKNLVENIVAICDNGVPKIPRKWANVRSISIKTPESMALPIYNKTPEELAEIARLAGLDQLTPKGDTAKEVEESEDDADKVNDTEDDDKSNEKRKKTIVSKSPLVRAVKRQLEDAKEKKEESPSKKQKTSGQGATVTANSGQKNATKKHKSQVKKSESDQLPTEQDEPKSVVDSNTKQPSKKHKMSAKETKAERPVAPEASASTETDNKGKEQTPNKKNFPRKESESNELSTKQVANETETVNSSSKKAQVKKQKTGTSDDKSSKKSESKKKEATAETNKLEQNVETPDSRTSPKSKRQAEPSDENTPRSKKPKPDKKKSKGSAKKDGLETPKTEQLKPNQEAEGSTKAKKKNNAKAKSDEPQGEDVASSNTSEKPAFIASQKFKGSKEGYVFKKEKQGVGYYVDVKPLVDPMVLEAFTKTAKKSPSSGGRGNTKSKGKRKSRHSR